VSGTARSRSRLADAGIKVAAGSDYWEGPASPLWMVQFWVTRAIAQGGVIGSEQKIRRAEALRLHTISDAYLSFEEGRRKKGYVRASQRLTQGNDRVS
jgi:predicted amidohydrolase YtcJ